MYGRRSVTELSSGKYFAASLGLVTELRLGLGLWLGLGLGRPGVRPREFGREFGRLFGPGKFGRGCLAA